MLFRTYFITGSINIARKYCSMLIQLCKSSLMAAPLVKGTETGTKQELSLVENVLGLWTFFDSMLPDF